MLQGIEDMHTKLRQQVVEHIRDHQEMFAPFVEDDEPFDRYVARMKKVRIYTVRLFSELIFGRKSSRRRFGGHDHDHDHQPACITGWLLGRLLGTCSF